MRHSNPDRIFGEKYFCLTKNEPFRNRWRTLQKTVLAKELFFGWGHIFRRANIQQGTFKFIRSKKYAQKKNMFLSSSNSFSQILQKFNTSYCLRHSNPENTFLSPIGLEITTGPIWTKIGCFHRYLISMKAANFGPNRTSRYFQTWRAQKCVFRV